MKEPLIQVRLSISIMSTFVKVCYRRAVIEGMDIDDDEEEEVEIEGR